MSLLQDYESDMTLQDPLAQSPPRHSAAADLRTSDSGAYRLPSTNQTLQQRLVFYLLGGAAVLAFLLALSSSINPPDSELREAYTAADLAAWDGIWKGTEVLYSLDGTRIAEYESHREYWSSSESIQTVQGSRTSSDGSTEKILWVNKILAEGNLVSQPTLDSGSSVPFEGRIDDGMLFWYQENADARIVRRSWIMGNSLHTEQISIPRDGSQGTVLTGVFKRIPAEP